jgi:hypothetical protein
MSKNSCDGFHGQLHFSNVVMYFFKLTGSMGSSVANNLYIHGAQHCRQNQRLAMKYPPAKHSDDNETERHPLHQCGQCTLDESAGTL